MNDKIISKNKNKNISITSNTVNVYLTIDKDPVSTLSLKSILKNSLSGAFYLENLKIQLILAENIHVDLIDDLLDFDITRSKLEVVLNKDSTINYELKMLDQHKLNHTDDGLLVAYNSQGYIEKELDFKFVGEHSQAKIRCSCKGDHNSLFKFKTVQDHKAAHTKSDLLIKGAFCKKSKIVCDSLIRVARDAQKVEAVQLNKNLLLGCNSRAISIPKLEVQADDVKCKHGATVSRLDDDHIFYLQSRGIEYCHAKNILIDSFLS